MLQIVGNVAEVTYEGEAHYPEEPVKKEYEKPYVAKPYAAAPAYKAAPASYQAPYEPKYKPQYKEPVYEPEYPSYV